jgi:hypothetical protein
MEEYEGGQQVPAGEELPGEGLPPMSETTAPDPNLEPVLPSDDPPEQPDPDEQPEPEPVQDSPGVPAPDTTPPGPDPEPEPGDDDPENPPVEPDAE